MLTVLYRRNTSLHQHHHQNTQTTTPKICVKQRVATHSLSFSRAHTHSFDINAYMERKNSNVVFFSLSGCVCVRIIFHRFIYVCVRLCCTLLHRVCLFVRLFVWVLMFYSICHACVYYVSEIDSDEPHTRFERYS